MARNFGDIAFTPVVRQAQRRYAGREHPVQAPRNELGAREAGFIAARDSFFMATVGETGWPYVQHRGGPAGFLQVLSPTTLAFADFSGNRQYVSAGNLAHDGRVSLILLDYPARRRLKILGHARIIDRDEAPADLLARVAPAEPGSAIERLIVIEVAVFDWNCSQHITPRYTESEWRARLDPTTR